MSSIKRMVGDSIDQDRFKGRLQSLTIQCLSDFFSIKKSTYLDERMVKSVAVIMLN